MCHIVTFSVGLSALCFLYVPQPSAARDFLPACTVLTSYGAFSPFCPFRAVYSVGLTALCFLYVPIPSFCPFRAISYGLTAPLPFQGYFLRAYSPLFFICSTTQRFRRRRLVLRSLGVGGRLWRTRRGLPRRNEMKPGLSGRLHWANFLRGLQPLCPFMAVYSIGLTALYIFLYHIPGASAVAGLSSAALA